MDSDTIYRKVYVKMYADARYRALSPTQPSGRALWHELIHGEHTTIIPGVIKCGAAAFAESLGWSTEAFREAFREVEAQGMAVADWDARLIWVPNAVKYNPPVSVNVVKSWVKAWPYVPECPLKHEAWQALRAYTEGMSVGFREAFAVAMREPESREQRAESREQKTPHTPHGGREPAGSPAGEGEVVKKGSRRRKKETDPALSAIWHEETGNKSPVTATKFGTARMAEGYTHDDLRAVARWCATSPEFATNREKGYLRVKTAWNEDNFEGYLGNARRKPGKVNGTQKPLSEWKVQGLIASQPDGWFEELVRRKPVSEWRDDILHMLRFERDEVLVEYKRRQA